MNKLSFLGFPSSLAALFLSLRLFDIGTPLSAQTVYTPYNFTTLAGTASFGHQDGTSAAARFAAPDGIAVDGSGNVYVADTDNCLIRKVTPGGVVTTLAGTAGVSGSMDGMGSAAQFRFPKGVAVDSSGNVYVADAFNYTIRKITPGGAVTTLAGMAGVTGSADGTGSSARFTFPNGIAVDGSGNIYVADSGDLDIVLDFGLGNSTNNTIRKITPNGVVTTLAGTADAPGSADGTGAAARFAEPYGIAVDGIGNVYVADTINNTIRKITSGGTVTTLAGAAGTPGDIDGTGSAARFEDPLGLAVDGSGNVYVTELFRDAIRKITPDGIVTTIAGVEFSPSRTDGTGTSAGFSGPYGLAADQNGNVYVADTGNGSIRVITPGGIVATLAGPSFGPGYEDGTGAQAEFQGPKGVAVDGARNVCIADSENAVIRKIAPGGVVTTFAGTAGAMGTADGTGAAARFNVPVGIAVDGSGIIYVADYNGTIRKITPSGMVTTLAGTAGVYGNADGIGAAAQFDTPSGVAVDGAGNVYVADTDNSTIRKITPGGMVTTIAGGAHTLYADGVGAAAGFYYPTGVAVDGAGNVYVADTENSVIRKITPDGVVTTFAGTAGRVGSADGIGAIARFNFPSRIAVDGNGNLFVTDELNSTIRKITPDAVVTTLAGTPGTGGSGDGVGAAAQFSNPEGIAVDGNGNVYVADWSASTIRMGSPVWFAQEPSSETVASGRSMVLNVTGSGSPAPNYQWSFNGTPILGATDPVLLVDAATSANAGAYTCTISNSSGSATSASATLAVATTSNPGHLVNLSARADVGIGNNVMIGGFGISGTGTKQLLLRGVGPALLNTFSLSGELAAPQLTLLDNSGLAIASDIGWANTLTLGSSASSYSPQAAPASLMSTLGAFAYQTGSADTAIVVTAPTGNATAQVSGIGGTSGIALVEVYDADTGTPTARLINMSARANVGTGNNILIGGFAVGGSTAETVLIRAVGPGLTDVFGLIGTLTQPVLTLLNNSGAVICTNTVWGGDETIAGVFPAVGAFNLTSGHADSVLLVTLAPGNYTAQVSGLNNGTGIALCEIYEVY